MTWFPIVVSVVVLTWMLVLACLPAIRQDDDALEQSYRVVNDDRIDWLAVVENSVETRKAA